jgi:hypothetical protein
MSDDLIFFKTFAGEDAVRDRTRLVQRNLRMVLILVDGLTNVASLKQKSGDPAMIETALADLERIGLIASVQTPSAKDGGSVVEMPVIAETELPSDLDAYADTPTVDTVFEQLSTVLPGTGSEGPAPAVAPVSSPAMLPPQPRSSIGWITRTRQRWGQMREERTYENAYGKASKVMVDASPAPDVAISSPPFKSRPKRNIRAALAFALVVLSFLGLAWVIFYPYDEYRPAFEARLSKILADDVSIGNVKLSFTPSPVLLLERVVVGRDANTTIDAVGLTPDVRLLLSDQPFREVKLTGLRMREAGISRLSDWFPRDSIKHLNIERLAVENLSVDLGWVTLRDVSGTLKIGPQAGIAAFEGKTAQGELVIEAIPTSAGLKISAKSGQWVVPIEPPLTLSALDIAGTLSPGRFLIDKLQAQAFDGVISGSGRIVWQAAPSMTLDLALKHVSTARLLETVHASPLLEGEFAGQMQLTSNLPSAKWLSPDTRIEGSATVSRGRLKKLALAGALRNSAGPQQAASHRGGDTGFEEMSGKFGVDRGVVRVGSVRLASGLMNATGQAIVSRETGGISGTVNVEMRGSASAPRAQLAISGNSRDPELKTVR